MTPLPGTEGAWQPVFAPDGRSLVFFADRKMKTVALEGGGVQTLAEIGATCVGQLGPGRHHRSGSEPDVRPLSRRGARGRPASPDPARRERGRKLAPLAPGSSRRPRRALHRGFRGWILRRGTARRRVPGHRRAPPYREQRGLWTLSPDRPPRVRSGRTPLRGGLRPRAPPCPGPPRGRGQGLRYDPQNGGTHLAVSATGTLVYSPAFPTSSERTLAFVDGQGRPSSLSDVGALVPGAASQSRRPPCGGGHRPRRRVRPLGARPRERHLSRLTFGTEPHRPVWTRDGTGITFGAVSATGFRLRRRASVARTRPRRCSSRHRGAPVARGPPMAASSSSRSGCRARAGISTLPTWVPPGR